ncbi:MAG: helix-turn-helix domain-containing protein, partial [Nitriliruptor sp.]
RSRTALLAVLREQPAGSGAHALATRLGLHVNTVRAHLALLEEAGLVASAPEHRGVRGRPRIVYRAVESSGVDVPDDGYQLLASVLAGGLARGAGDPAADAERIGQRWGRQVANDGGEGSDQHPTREATIARATALLERFGFAPAAAPDDPGVISLRRCPYLEVAAEHPDVVCRLHLGALRGALETAGHTTELSLMPFVTPTTCEVRIT